MSDDSFIREVDEELRSDRAQQIWKRYGKFIIGVAVALVLITAATRGYEYYKANQAAKTGDQFMEAVRLSNEGKTDDAIAELKKLSNSGSASYAVLAKLREGTELAKKGDKKAAIALFDEIAATAMEESYRDLANIRAGLLMVDEGTVDDVKERVASLALPGSSFRHTAREALGIANWKAGDLKKSAVYFNEILNDANAPRSAQERANVMLNLISGSGGPARDAQGAAQEDSHSHSD